MVDPGDAGPVLDALASRSAMLTAILITHLHADHIGGIARLRAHYPQARLIGPAGLSGFDAIDHVTDGARLVLDAPLCRLSILALPGHTPEHIGYLSDDGALFCGDTLFSAGCGRLLGGTAHALHASLQRLARLPADTRVYAAHEYTLANLAFARAAEPHNPDRDAWQTRCETRRANGEPTLPGRIDIECRINPFLRTDRADIAAGLVAAGRLNADDADDPQAVFRALRAWKDSF